MFAFWYRFPAGGVSPTKINKYKALIPKVNATVDKAIAFNRRNGEK